MTVPTRPPGDSTMLMSGLVAAERCCRRGRRRADQLFSDASLHLGLPAITAGA